MKRKLKTKSAMEAKMWLYDMLDAIGRRTGLWTPMADRKMPARELYDLISEGEDELRNVRAEYEDYLRGDEQDPELRSEYQRLIADMEQRLQQLRDYVEQLRSDDNLDFGKSVSAPGAHKVYG